ncbi:MAG: hypothetical protein ACRDPY_26545 [Streptosporangiaceae bacterium]
MVRPALAALGRAAFRIGRKAGHAMTRRQRNELVAVRAAFILAEDPSYTLHFETQMRRGRVWRLFFASHAHFARIGEMLSGFDTGEFH